MYLILSSCTMCVWLNHAVQHCFEISARNRCSYQLFLDAEGRKVSISCWRSKKILLERIRIILSVSSRRICGIVWDFSTNSSGTETPWTTQINLLHISECRNDTERKTSLSKLIWFPLLEIWLLPAEVIDDPEHGKWSKLAHKGTGSMQAAKCSNFFIEFENENHMGPKYREGLLTKIRLSAVWRKTQKPL